MKLFCLASRIQPVNSSQLAQIAHMLLQKNFSILVEFQQKKHSLGALFAIYAGPSKVLEIVSDCSKEQLRIK